ncbi:patatin-like phospholipase family protein [Pseudodesulfovibrio sediminis]|uniref:Lipoprotein n=1 Tax=Pseudodesulfovibrio sediminis TaxID=2810563 RepID=A0ABM7P8P5_9BACT|nr:patatin-like phospholipase family protein [Pseudodesulfovibrio sediminis]BCS89402.1 lipoprotein [Pseudodesulfovibrio sediminis]
MARIRTCLALIFILTLMTGCGSTRNPLPINYQKMAQIPGFEHIRFYDDNTAASMKAILETWARHRKGDPDADFSVLSLSGGGAGGAFGAGYLSGWSDSGTRPEFSVVTGISTGALIAPFAFLGPGYDALITMLYTTYSTENLIGYTPTSLSLLNTYPMQKAIQMYISDEIIEAIAFQHRKGRRLIIGTTNLDEMEPVYWDIGAIAQYDTPEARTLIRDVVLASAAIPVAFPPVFFKVEAGGKLYDEMHVDGGITNQVFAYPPSIRLNEALHSIGKTGKISLYVIRNDLLKTPGCQTSPHLTRIASRSMDGLIRSQGIGDIYRIFYTTQRDNVDFNLAFIPYTFTEEPEELFDPVYMNKLYKVGYDIARSKSPWHKAPPHVTPQRDVSGNR